jgi:riboflavin transporter FmnP
LEKETAVTGDSPSQKSMRVRAIAGTGLFATLSLILTILSQTAGLNFPLIPYLQFDLGELAIIMAFMIFGPWPATGSAIVEFLALEIVGQNRPIGPLLKIASVMASLLGLWIGAKLSSKLTLRLPLIASASLATGIIIRVLVTTILNYYLIVGLYTLPVIIGIVQVPLKVVGVTISNANALSVLLTFTAVFNCAQLATVFLLAYFISRLPQVSKALRSSSVGWIELIGNLGKHSGKRVLSSN